MRSRVWDATLAPLQSPGDQVTAAGQQAQRQQRPEVGATGCNIGRVFWAIFVDMDSGSLDRTGSKRGWKGPVHALKVPVTLYASCTNACQVNNASFRYILSWNPFQTLQNFLFSASAAGHYCFICMVHHNRLFCCSK